MGLKMGGQIGHTILTRFGLMNAVPLLVKRALLCLTLTICNWQLSAQSLPDSLHYQGKADKETIVCLALNAYHEARSSTVEDQVGVTWTVLNRANSNKFPKHPCNVVRQHAQFSWYWDNRSDRPLDTVAWLRAVAVVLMVTEHGVPDPTGGALYYCEGRTKCWWRKYKQFTVKIGQHRYYK